MPVELNKTFSDIVSDLVIDADPYGTRISGSFDIPYKAEYNIDYVDEGLFNVLFGPKDFSNAICKKPFSLFDMLENEHEECEELKIERIIFNDPATVIFWSDGEKTVVKTAKGDTYNPYYGFCCAVTKRIFGNNSAIKKIMKRKGNLDTI